MSTGSNHFNHRQEILTKTSSGNLEVFLLGIFKWIVIVAMLILIAAALWLGGAGIFQMAHMPATPPTPKLAPKPSVLASGFYEVVKPVPVSEQPQPLQPPTPATLVADASDAAFKAQSESLWLHVSKYQTDCGVASPLTKGDFLESLRLTPLKRILEARSADFAIDQVAFMKSTLSSADILKLCKSGRGGLFMAALEFHRSGWDKQVQEAHAFETRERAKVVAFEERERAELMASKANAYKNFLSAAIAFGLFMSVAMVLIFARVESNLRGIQSIVRIPTESIE